MYEPLSASLSATETPRAKPFVLITALTVFVGFWTLIGTIALHEWSDTEDSVYGYGLSGVLSLLILLIVALERKEYCVFPIFAFLPSASLGFFTGWILSIAYSSNTNNNIQTMFWVLTGIAVGLVFELLTGAFAKAIDWLLPIRPVDY